MDQSGRGGAGAAAAGTGGVIRRGLSVLGIAMAGEPRVLLVAVAGSALYGAATVLTSVVLGAATDRVIVPAVADRRAAISSVATCAALILAVAAARAGGMFVRRYAAGITQYRLQATFRQRVIGQYLRLPLAWHQRHTTGTLLSNANADVEAAWAPIAPLPFALGVVVMLFVALGLLLATDWVLTLVGLVVFPAFGLANVAYGRAVSPLLARAQQLRSEVSAVAHESFDGALVVKTLGREQAETVRFGAVASDLRDAMIRAGRVRGMFDPLMEALPNLGVLAVLLVGAIRINSGALSFGDLVRVAYLFTLLAFPIRSIGWVFGEMPRSVVGYGRVAAVLAARGAQDHGSLRLDGTGPLAVNVEDVAYRYAPSLADGDEPEPRGGHDALTGVTFTVPPGRIVAVVGRTGAGKSTLAGLVVRLVDPDTGQVELDGIRAADLRDGEVTGAAALVAQQAFLFDDTIRGNVTLGFDASDEEVWSALAAAAADTFVAALPAGLDTLVGERGATLSGGQRQRVALARALLRRPRLLVLDDATSSVDPRVEAAILGGLRDRVAESTVIVVAYRRATIALADEVVLLAAGRITDRGTHRELMARSSVYAGLVQAYDTIDDAEPPDRPRPAGAGSSTGPAAPAAAARSTGAVAPTERTTPVGPQPRRASDRKLTAAPAESDAR